MSAPEERRGKKEGQEKQDLHKRVWMDIEDGWHFHKHMHAHMRRPTLAVPSAEGSEHKGNGVNENKMLGVVDGHFY